MKIFNKVGSALVSASSWLLQWGFDFVPMVGENPIKCIVLFGIGVCVGCWVCAAGGVRLGVCCECRV